MSQISFLVNPQALVILILCADMTRAQLGYWRGNLSLWEHAVAVASRSAQGSEQVLYSFTGGSDGGNAATGLVFDGNGDLYGTTVTGGTTQCGTVFELMSQASPPWPETVLHNFGAGADGSNPHADLLKGKDRFFGTTSRGGTYGRGTVFTLSP